MFLPPPVTRGGARGFRADQLAAYYSFPAEYDGTGTTIAIVSLYGGFRRSDLGTYFSAFGLPSPAVETVSVDGATNNPVADPQANGELVLSLEILGSVAPGAKLVVYQAPNTELGTIDGLAAAVFDQERHPNVVCLPLLMDEDETYPMLASAIGDRILAAALTGVSVCAPAGYWTDGTLHPTAPGSHPSLLACGSTRAVEAGAGLTEQPMVSIPGPPARSTIWPSDDIPPAPRRAARPASRRSVRPAPSHSAPPKPPGRAVPDVCALADEEIGYLCFINGSWLSAVSPVSPACMWAGLLARLRQALGRPFFIDPVLRPGVMRPVPDLIGPSASQPAPAWDSRVGWGSPDGERLLAALRSRK